MSFLTQKATSLRIYVQTGFAKAIDILLCTLFCYSEVFEYRLSLLLLIIIIKIFQEDNIFGTDVSLTYCPPITDVDMLLQK